MRRVSPFDARGYYYYYGAETRGCKAPAVLGGFSPLSLGPSGFWLPEPAFLFEEEDGTGTISADEAVGYMADQSGNGRHLLQATAGARPLYKTSGGLHWVECDGTDDTLVSDAFTVSQPLTIMVAMRQITEAANDVFFDCQAVAALQGAGGTADFFAGATVTGPALPAAGTDFILTTFFSGASSSAVIDAGTPVTGDAGAQNVLYFQLARRTSFGNFFDGRFAGGILFDRQLSASEQAQLLTYFAAKQGRVL